ncbi:MAG: alpha-hydroxy-acid oxidizing enzyme [Streptosporangiales bacterium]|nr:alpha-hydroxy-acid oxidizing enzyme [Streptosporangiales bacterium]
MLPPRPTLPSTQARLRGAADVADVRELARRRAPRMVFDFVDGAADGEQSLRAATEAFDEVTFHPRILRDVSTVSTATKIFGRSVGMPLVLAPTGFTRISHREGEPAVARAAEAARVPYTLSTMGTTPADEVAAAAPDGWNWFQLYVVRDRAQSTETLQRAKEAGMDVLVVTVDVPVLGSRLRDVRHGMTIPPTLRWRSAMQAVTRPAWWFDFITSEPLRFATAGGSADNLAGIINTLFDPSVTFADLEWIRSVWDGKILVKGVQDVSDAKQLASIGVDGIIVSNHGGRQLDRAPAPLDLLPHVREAVGDDTTLFLDGGVRRGSDIAAAVGLGADAAFVGRGYLYGLMAGGGPGVSRVIEILHRELMRTMQLLGVRTVAELNSDLVSARTQVGR